MRADRPPRAHTRYAAAPPPGDEREAAATGVREFGVAGERVEEEGEQPLIERREGEQR